MNIIRKSKGAYLFYLNNNNKYFDFTSNSNILGHSFKKLTTIVKNDISSRWNIKNHSIYHRRMEKLLFSLFGTSYIWKISFSLKDLFFRILHYFKIEIKGDYLQEWFNKIFLPINNSGPKSLTIFDMAYYYLFDKKIETDYSLKIANYYFYPELEINLTENFDLIILPEFFSGNFSYLNILVKKGSVFENIFDNPEQIPSLYISASLKNYYLIKKYNVKFQNFLDEKLFLQKNRIFILKNMNQEILKYLQSKRIIINTDFPFYNYLPIILKDHEIKYLSSIKMV